MGAETSFDYSVREIELALPQAWNADNMSPTGRSRRSDLSFERTHTLIVYNLVQSVSLGSASIATGDTFPSPSRFLWHHFVRIAHLDC